MMDESLDTAAVIVYTVCTMEKLRDNNPYTRIPSLLPSPRDDGKGIAKLTYG